MKIAHLIYSLNTGGAETMLVDIVNEQIKQAEVSIIIINKTYNRSLLEKIDKKVKVYFINRIESSKNPFPILKLNVLLFKSGGEVLHCHNHNIIPLILPGLKKKAVLTIHCIGIPSKYLNQYHRLFAISESVRKDILNRTNINSIVVYNGIATNIISQKENYKIKSQFNIVCIGRLNHNIKGQHLAIEALRILKDKGISNIQLDLIGAGLSETYLIELAEKLEVKNQIKFLGLMDRDYIYSNLKDYDLLIQPSLYEGFGLTIAEAMAAKVPILVSDIDGPMEIIENGKYGFHFQSGNIEDISKSLNKIINIYPSIELKDIVETAYGHVKENFGITTTSLKYLQYYQQE